MKENFQTWTNMVKELGYFEPKPIQAAPAPKPSTKIKQKKVS